MNIRGWIDEILAELGEDVKINYFKKRLQYPDAVYNPARDSITIWANGPSLVRYGILFLLIHELSHKVHNDRYGEPGDDFSDSFRQIEIELIEKGWELCRKED